MKLGEQKRRQYLPFIRKDTRYSLQENEKGKFNQVGKLFPKDQEATP